MTPWSVFTSLRAHLRATPSRPKPRTRQLSIETLEDRSTPSATPAIPLAITSLEDNARHNLVGQVSNDTTPKVIGTAPANSAVVILVDGQQTSAAFSDFRGVWSSQLVTPLTDGAHTVAVRLASGGSASPGAVYRVDTVAPQVQLSGAAAGAFQVSVIDASNIPTLYLDVDRTGSGQFGGASVGYATIQLGLNRLPDLPPGDYLIRVRAVDAGGNTGTSTVFTTQSTGVPAALGDTWLMRMATLGSNAPAARPTGTPTALDTANQISDAQMRSLYYTDGDRVLVAARANRVEQTDAFLAALIQRGMQVIDVTRTSALVTGWLASSQIAQLVTIPNFAAATAVPRATSDAGSVTTEGDAVINGPVFRATTGATGKGVKVGVMSDSADQVGTGVAGSQATGDLPPVVEVLRDSAGGTDEGRAMMEIVHDIAPGAALAFHTASGGPAVFANGIRALAADGCKVIVDDIRYINSPVYNAGLMGQAVEQVYRQGVVYATAVGNTGSFGWRGNFVPMTARVGNLSGTFANINGSPLQRFILPTGQSILLKFNWDNPYLEGGSPLPNFQVTARIAVHIINPTTGQILATFNNNNLVTDEAYQTIIFNNAAANLTNTFAFAYQLITGPAPKRITWISWGSTVTTLNVAGEGAPTSVGQKLAEHAITVGAVNYATPNVMETFSARGGNLPIVADDLTGARFATAQIRQKPNVVAPDGVTTSVTGFAPFLGTSAAAPHVAGAAALLFAQDRYASADDVFEHLEGTAIPLNGVRVFNPLSGYGRIYLRPLLRGADRYEPNNTEDRATWLGTVSSFNVANLTIRPPRGGAPVDYDWFGFTASQSGALSAIATNSRLEVHLFVRTNGFLVEVGQNYRVRAGQRVYVEVKGRPLAPGRSGKGVYDLRINIA